MNKDEGVFDPLGDSKDGHIFSRAIIDTIHEPLIVLDASLRVIVASRSFYEKFRLTHENTRDKMFYHLGNGQWNIPALRTLLELVLPKHRSIKDYEIESNFVHLGLRTLCLNAHEIQFENGKSKMMLISIFDVTDQRILEAEKQKVLTQKNLLLKEMRHRIANSLQLIASILLIKAESVDSKESRAHLEDAHERIMSIAMVQRELDPIERGEKVAVGEYLDTLCKSLARSMIGGRKPIALVVKADSRFVSSDTAISFGLITTELVINALKHAFTKGQKGEIVVTYAVKKSGWTLSVEDNGVGESDASKNTPRGLGTSIIGALANQLQAVIRTKRSPNGTRVSIVHTRT